MALVKKSFLSDLISRYLIGGEYEEIKNYAKKYLVIGTCVLVILYPLSIFFYWIFISRLLNLTTGTSLLFIVYIASVIVCLDKRVEVDEPESSNWSKPTITPRTRTYKLTIVWGILLIVLGIATIFFSDRYRKQYAFYCSEIYVDNEAGIFHLEWTDCEITHEKFDDLHPEKGYYIKGTDYRFCDECRKILKEAEEAYYGDLLSH